MMDDTMDKLRMESKNLDRFKGCLNRSKEQTTEMVSILSRFDDRLSKLEETIKPVYKETGNLQEQQDNILKTLEYLDYVITFYTVASESEPMVRAGPNHGQLDGYLKILDQLENAVKYFEGKNPESPELLNVSSLFTMGSEQVEREFRQLLSRHSFPVPAILILDLVNEQESTSQERSPQKQQTIKEKEMQMLGQLDDRVTGDLRMLAKWLSEYKSDDFIAVYANIRSDILMKSLTNLRDHLKTQSGTGPHASPLMSRKSLTGNTVTSTATSTVLGMKGPKAITSVYKKLTNAMPGEYLKVSRSQTMDHLREEPPISDREIVCYITSVTALYKLMQSELQLMQSILPLQMQKTIFCRLVSSPLNTIVKEGDDLASRVKRSVARSEFPPVVTLFPILRHLASMRHSFDLLLDGCSQEVVSKFQGLVINLQTTISKALNEFIDSIKSDADTKVPRDGTVHELTSNVMIFVEHLLDFVDILSRVITGPSSDQIQRSKDRNKLVYAQYITRVLSALGLTLRLKGEVYSDPHLRAIFMLNNFHYILKRLRKSNLMPIVNMFDRDIELFYEEQILENKREYSKSWSKILHILYDMDGKDMPSVDPSAHNMKLKDKDRKEIKDKFHLFNKEFDEVKRAQIAYAIPDGELREDLKKDNRTFILPRFTTFYNKYSGLNFAKHMDKYVKYTPQSLGDTMDTFFDSAA